MFRERMGSTDNSSQKSTRKPNANILWLMLSSLYTYNAVFTSLRFIIYSAADTGVYNVPDSHAAPTQMQRLGKFSVQIASDPGCLSLVMVISHKRTRFVSQSYQ